MKWSKKPLGEAILGFRTKENIALKNIGNTDIPSHAIVGIAPDDETSDTEISLNRLLRLLGVQPFESIDSLLDPVNKNAHDTIVSFESQMGGLDGSEFSIVFDVVHANAEVKNSDINETASEEIFNIVHELLKAKVNKDNFGFFKSFPHGDENNSASIVNEEKEMNTNSFRTNQSTTNATISFSPETGTFVKPGETIQINFNIANGNPVEGAFFTINGSSYIIEGSPPYTFEYQVPLNKAR